MSVESPESYKAICRPIREVDSVDMPVGFLDDLFLRRWSPVEECKGQGNLENSNSCQ